MEAQQNKGTHPASDNSFYGETRNQISYVTAQRFNHKFIYTPAFSMPYSCVCTKPVLVKINWRKWLWLEQGRSYVSKCKGRLGSHSLGTLFTPREKTACEACLEAGVIEARLASSQHLFRCCWRGTDPLHRQVAQRRAWYADGADVLCIWKTLRVEKA